MDSNFRKNSFLVCSGIIILISFFIVFSTFIIVTGNIQFIVLLISIAICNLYGIFSFIKRIYKSKCSKINHIYMYICTIISFVSIIFIIHNTNILSLASSTYLYNIESIKWIVGLILPIGIPIYIDKSSSPKNTNYTYNEYNNNIEKNLFQ